VVSRAAQKSHLFRWIWRQPRAAPAPSGAVFDPCTVYPPNREGTCWHPAPGLKACAQRNSPGRRPRGERGGGLSGGRLCATPARSARLARTANKAAVRQSFRWHNPQCAPGHRRRRPRSPASPAGSRPTKCQRPRHPVSGHSLHLIPKSDRPQSLRRWLRPDRCRLTLR
jgi:hypothetical protein